VAIRRSASQPLIGLPPRPDLPTRSSTLVPRTADRPFEATKLGRIEDHDSHRAGSGRQPVQTGASPRSSTNRQPTAEPEETGAAASTRLQSLVARQTASGASTLTNPMATKAARPITYWGTGMPASAVEAIVSGPFLALSTRRNHYPTVVGWSRRTEGSSHRGLIIRLIIQMIRRDPSRSAWIDEASSVSRPDPSGTDQIDAEHPSRNRKVEGSKPSSGSKTPGQRDFGIVDCATTTGGHSFGLDHRAAGAPAPRFAA
jgi:hypothetical protein